MEIISFGGFELSMIDEETTLPFAVRSNLVELPYGSFDETGQDVILRPYNLTRVFKITDVAQRLAKVGNEIDDLMQVLQGGRKVLRARFPDGSHRQTFAKVLEVSRPRRENDKTYREITITWQIDYPYWLKREEEPHYLDHLEFLDAGWSLDANYSLVVLTTTTATFSIANSGNVPFRRGVIVILPQTGASLIGLKVVNKTNQMQFTFVGDVSASDFLVIDLLAQSVKRSTINAYDELEIPATQMDWMQIEVGTNEIELTASAIVGTVNFEWHWASHFV